MVRGKYMPWQLLKRWWEEITGSTHVDIRKIDTRGKAAFYIAKYIGKDLAPFEGCKRWWRSHGYSEEDTDEYERDTTWPAPTRYRVDFHRLAFAARYMGWQVERLKPEGVRWTAPPDCPLGHDAIIAMAANATQASHLKTGWNSR